MGEKSTTNEAMTEVGEEKGKGGRNAGGGGGQKGEEERKVGAKEELQRRKEGRDTLETDNTNHLRSMEGVGWPKS